MVGKRSEVHTSRSKAPFPLSIDTVLAQVGRVQGIERDIPPIRPPFLFDTGAIKANASPRGWLETHGSKHSLLLDEHTPSCDSVACQTGELYRAVCSV